MKTFILPLLLLFAACVNDPTSPEAALKDFIDLRIGHTVSRDAILERVTGKMRQSFENMSEEDFNKFADMSAIKKESFKVLSKSCQEKVCFLTYSVGYRTSQDDKVKYQSEIKKIAEIHLIENKWLIEDVSNIKTYHEAVEPINPLE
jgi:phosphopantetheinyl transferase (holo-ACP synthase)